MQTLLGLNVRLWRACGHGVNADVPPQNLTHVNFVSFRMGYFTVGGADRCRRLADLPGRGIMFAWLWPARNPTHPRNHSSVAIEVRNSQLMVSAVCRLSRESSSCS